MDTDRQAEFVAKDETIDDLVSRAEALARELRIVVASMKMALTARHHPGLPGEEGNA